MQPREDIALTQLMLSVVLVPLLIAAVIMIAVVLLAMITVELAAEGFSFLNEQLFAFVDWYNERIP